MDLPLDPRVQRMLLYLLFAMIWCSLCARGANYSTQQHLRNNNSDTGDAHYGLIKDNIKDAKNVMTLLSIAAAP